jgi:lipoprotein NlpD
MALASFLLLAPPVVGDPPPSVAPRAHVVARGETLGSIASRYGVSVAALVAANRLPSERVTLRVGQRLTLPVTGPPRAVASARPPAANAPARPTTSSAQATPSPGAKPSSPATTSSPGKPSPQATTSPAAKPSPQAPASPPAQTRTAMSRATPPPPVTRGPRGLELAVPDFVEVSPLFTWPVEGPVTSTFGRRRSAWHRGIDIKADRGAVVFAAAGGVVVTSGVEPRYGRVVKIEHDDGFVTVYAHNEENLVQAGMHVSPGDPIATIGRTGRATAHHLHFEIRRNGAVYNPLYLLPLPPRVGQVEESDEPDEEHE